jgi:hypothetical protein
MHVQGVVRAVLVRGALPGFQLPWERAFERGLFTFESESCPSFDPCPEGTFHSQQEHQELPFVATHTM